MTIDKLDQLELERLSGAGLLDRIHELFGTYVVFPSPQAHDAAVLWASATHGQCAWEHAPRLAVVSPEKRCGKSRLMDVIEATSYNPLVTINASPAAVVRSIDEDDPPTLMVDEADTIFGSRKAAENHEDIRGILNAGHQRNRPYIRWDVTSRAREECPTFAMAMLATIGDLPDTIMDRAVVIRMRRRGANETVAPYRTRRDAPALRNLRSCLSSWLKNHVEKLQNAEPDLPVEDRAADTWEPLIAVADLAGGDWPERARNAAMMLVAAENESDADASLSSRLLRDIRTIFDQQCVSFLPSRDLTNRLRGIDDAPWPDLDLTMGGLANRLRPYGIRPRQDATGTVRGYRLEDFTDAFARYVPPPSAPVKVSETGSEQGKRSDTSPNQGVGLPVGSPPGPTARAAQSDAPSDTSSDTLPKQTVSGLTGGFDSLTPSDTPRADQTATRRATPLPGQPGEDCCEGGSVKPKCKLCPKSPTYWKRS